MVKGDDCTIGATHTADIASLQRLAEENREDHTRMWDAMDKLKNRLPLWATLVISILMAVLGILATMAAK